MRVKAATTINRELVSGFVNTAIGSSPKAASTRRRDEGTNPRKETLQVFPILLIVMCLIIMRYTPAACKNPFCSKEEDSRYARTKRGEKFLRRTGKVDGKIDTQLGVMGDGDGWKKNVTYDEMDEGVEL
jgi:hypothetical protein